MLNMQKLRYLCRGGMPLLNNNAPYVTAYETPHGSVSPSWAGENTYSPAILCSGRRFFKYISVVTVPINMFTLCISRNRKRTI